MRFRPGGLILNLNGPHYCFAMCRALEQELTVFYMFFSDKRLPCDMYDSSETMHNYEGDMGPPSLIISQDNDFILKIVQNFSRRENRPDLLFLVRS